MAGELGVAPIVRFHGWLGWEGLSTLYARAHVFVHCSRKEGFGKVLLEAMTYALPIVGTDAGVSPAVIEPPKAGYVIVQDDPALLADTLESAFADRDELAAKGRRGRERVVPYLLEHQEGRYRAFLEHELGLTPA
jgi:glycosyltransferase involved in cell wall biosynthesis